MLGNYKPTHFSSYVYLYIRQPKQQYVLFIMVRTRVANNNTIQLCQRECITDERKSIVSIVSIVCEVREYNSATGVQR